jgi:elongation factor G
MSSQDPTFGHSTDRASGNVIVMGTDEDNLDGHLTALRSSYAVELNLGAPQVRYRETVSRPVEVDHTLKRIDGRRGEFARIKLRIEPGEPGAGSTFKSEIVGGVVPDAYIGAVEKGVRRATDAGILAGFPVDARVSLYDGAYHEIDSSWTAFEATAHAAMLKGASQAGVRVVEPVMDVLVATPGECSEAVIDDIRSRHGRIRNRKRRGEMLVILASAPLAHLLGYAPALCAITDGRARSRVRFRDYAGLQGYDGPDDFAPAAAMRP